jgi:3-hydroxyisobutyrate dehydrogenase
MDEPKSLDDALRAVWSDLTHGAADARAPFHTPALACIGADGCDVRTVVLRRATPERRELAFHTDARAPKVADLCRNPATAWAFYDPARKIQVRAKGATRVHHGDDVAREAWERTPPMSRRCYLIQRAPSAVVDACMSGLPEPFVERSPTLEESEAGWANFAVCVTVVTRLDWLHLAAKGHRRAAFDWNGETFAGAWIIP